MFCCTLLYVHSSIAIILMGKRELIAFLNLSSWCLVMVERLFLAVPWGCLQFVIVVFPDHTHLLFLIKTNQHCNEKHVAIMQGGLDLAVLFTLLASKRQNRNQVYWNIRARVLRRTPSSEVTDLFQFKMVEYCLYILR